MCDVINAGLDQLFSSREFPHLKVIATPGRNQFCVSCRYADRRPKVFTSPYQLLSAVSYLSRNSLLELNPWT
ncbi:unnamed protein product [Nippostrongylus brasiliensis]|uniref:Transposase n=1 Tax=Nippostrongylus brasiliensis TaxID=27835 RepID=A0A0N4XKM9_NIPBR|nr:unnamed protein product [Nippostrongylus brasiliensis]